ncbi:MAG: DUF4956 domain-containing protein [Clostridia bacterium]|nr:DUF4956 domain-containing protein [Clostridia bacterium]
MLNSIISYTSTTPLTLMDALVLFLVSIILGLMISLTYMRTSKNGKYVSTFAITLIVLPMIIAAIIMLIGSDIAKAFSLAGAFSIIRFRSAPGDPKDITFVLFALAAGLGAGVGIWWFALIFTVLMCLIMIVIHIFKFGSSNQNMHQLKITIPEDLDYAMVFNEVFSLFTKEHRLIQVKTIAMGSLYQLTYDITLLKERDIKTLIDEIRCRNSNLNIVLQPIETEF